MPLRYYPTGDLDNASAVEDILSRYGEDVHRGQEIRAWLHRLVDLAADMEDYGMPTDDCGVPIEDLFWPEGAPHYCSPVCEGGCADTHRRTRSTCVVTLPGNAPIAA